MCIDLQFSLFSFSTFPEKLKNTFSDFEWWVAPKLFPGKTKNSTFDSSIFEEEK